MDLQTHTWAIIPAKPFALGKSRLACVLDASTRATLNRALFEHVFEVATAELGPGRVAVVTADADLLARVQAQGAHAVREQTADDLNVALAQATRYVASRGAPAVLVLPSDLPYLSGGDIAVLRAAAGPAPCAAIAPDAADEGTNALLLAPPDPDFFRFGAASFAAHVEAGRTRGLATRIVRRPGLARDLDTPEDYRMFTELPPVRWGLGRRDTPVATHRINRGVQA